jgi:hypothetical protein
VSSRDVRHTVKGRLAYPVLSVICIALIVAGWLLLNMSGQYFRDTLAYWRPDFDDLYGGGRVGIRSTYLYSPAFAQLMAIPGLLPMPWFLALWSAVNLVALIWMAGPILAALLFLIPGSPVVDEISTGNIHLILAAAIVLAFRSPPRSAAAWALPLLTKVTPAIGVAWYVGARQWRSLGVALASTAAIVLVSFALSAGLWFEWVDTLIRSGGVAVPADIGVIPGPLWARTAVGALLAAGAGAIGWTWLVPVAATVALPVTWSSGLSILVASIPLGRRWLKQRSEDRRTVGTPEVGSRRA